MYLSKLLLNPRHSQAQLDLAAPYELHRTLGKSFPTAETNRYRSECGVLFRVEPLIRKEVVVLVQSLAEPDWSALPPGYALQADGPRDFNPALKEGQRLRFRLAANPVMKVREDGKKHSVRFPLIRDRYPEDEEGIGYIDWLDRQATDHGFSVEAVADVPFRVARRRKRGQNLDKAEIPHFGVRFDGLLQVTDPEKLMQAVRNGIGPAKAFGFGLLSLARAE